MKISSKLLHSQAVRARELTFWGKVNLTPPVLCHISHVKCHMSHVMCNFFLRFVIFFVRQSGNACLWRVFYRWGLPRLVLMLPFQFCYFRRLVFDQKSPVNPRGSTEPDGHTDEGGEGQKFLSAILDYQNQYFLAISNLKNIFSQGRL